jgi:Zn-dependent protease
LIFLHGDLIGEDNLLFLTLVAATLFALLVGVGFHEACHAYMANSLGDRTPARQGRVTFNPMAHLDPAGTLMMVFVGFGWGKPVQFNPYGLRSDPKTATLLVSAAGPVSNLVMAVLLGIPIRLGLFPYLNPFTSRPRADTFDEYVGLFLTSAVSLNVILGLFNLVPIHPLDGFKVVLGLLPDDLAQDWAKLAKYGPGMLMLLIALPFVTSINPLGDILWPASRDIVRALTGGP